MKLKSLLVVLGVGVLCLPFMSYGKDLVALRQRAEQGDAEAQLSLGNHYYSGEDVSQGRIQKPAGFN